MSRSPFLAVLPALANLLPTMAQVRVFFDEAVSRRLLPDAAATAAFYPLIFGFFVLMSLAALAFIIFWLLMLIDCSKRAWPDRIWWIVVLVGSVFFGLHWLSALLYYFLVKRKNLGVLPAAEQPTGSKA